MILLTYLTLLVASVVAIPHARQRRATQSQAPQFNSFVNPGFGAQNVQGAVPFTSLLGGPLQRQQSSQIVFQNDGQMVDLSGIGAGRLPNVAPIPVPGFAGQRGIPLIPGVNTIPGLDMFNYLVGSLIPQAIPPANQLLGGSLSRLLPQDQTQNLAQTLFNTLAVPAINIEVPKMMGRWFQVINSPQITREACTVAHFGALTNNSYTATFTILKFYREDNPHGVPRFSLGYGFRSNENGTFVIHNSNSPDSEPNWVVKTGPLNEYNQYDYAIISNWVRYPVVVYARDAERFRNVHMGSVLQYLQDNNFINDITKALSMIAPVDYEDCQYTPTFAGTGF